jgi:hypothetical protein
MRSLACLPNSRVRSMRAEASPAMVARKSRTYRYSSVSSISSSRTWVRCAAMSAPPAGRAGGGFAPGFWSASPPPAPFAPSAC